MTRVRPSSDEISIALDAARRMREKSVDPHHIAASLLYLDERSQELEALYRLTDQYLRFGMPEQELSEMRKLLEHLRESEPSNDDQASDEGPLPI